MKLWGYYAFHTFINSVKKMFRSTFVIVLYSIIGVTILSGVAGGVIGWAVADNMITEYAYDENGNYVGEELGKYDEEELKTLQPAIDTSLEIIKSFVLAGINITMNQFNRKHK